MLVRIDVAEALVGVKKSDLSHGFGHPRFSATTQNLILRGDLGVPGRPIFHWHRGAGRILKNFIIHFTVFLAHKKKFVAKSRPWVSRHSVKVGD